MGGTAKVVEPANADHAGLRSDANDGAAHCFARGAVRIPSMRVFNPGQAPEVGSGEVTGRSQAGTPPSRPRRLRPG